MVNKLANIAMAKIFNNRHHSLKAPEARALADEVLRLRIEVRDLKAATVVSQPPTPPRSHFLVNGDGSIAENIRIPGKRELVPPLLDDDYDFGEEPGR